jgi:signal transduction histidine kinase
VEVNTNGPAAAGSVAVESVQLRAPHDPVTLSRRIRVIGEDLGLHPREVRRLAVAAHESARVFDGSAAAATIGVADGPALEVAFVLRLDTEADRGTIRSRLDPVVSTLRPLVDSVLVDEGEGEIALALRMTLCAEAAQRLALLPGAPAGVQTSVDADVSLETLRERYQALEQDYRDLQLELQETNSGVIAIYAELEDQTARLREVEERLRRRAEDLAAANRAKEDFLATLSHELRTPLNAMLGWTRLLRTGKLDAASAAKALETIERNARAQEQLIADILDVSRIVTGKLRLKLAPLDLAPVVHAALDAVRPAAEAKGILVRSAIACQLTVLGDTDRLQQVFWNLLANGIKFTPPRGEVTIGLDRAGSQAIVTVQDTGEGIAEELLPYVFDRFTQGDGSATRAHGGLGLGLSIVRHLVELHGGSVHAASEGKGKGALFAVHLPLRDGSAEPAA